MAFLPGGGFDFKPLLSFEGQAQGDASKDGCFGVNANGEVEIRGNAGAGIIKISCNEYPYISLLEATKTKALQITRLRLTVATDAQIDNAIKYFSNTMGGGVKENVINPRAYFKPNQFQGKTIDIDQTFLIDGKSGLLLTVNSNELVRLSLFVSGGMQINLTVSNTTASTQKVELFSAFLSSLNIRKAEYVNN
jgi:hypothetical protein